MAWELLASAAIGAAGSIIGGNKAANAAEKAGDQAAQVQREALATSVALGRPQLEVGTSALGVLAGLFGLPAPTPIDFDAVQKGNSIPGGVSTRPNDFEVRQVYQKYAGRAPTKTELKYYTNRRGRGDQLYNDVILGTPVHQQEQQAASPAGQAAPGTVPQTSTLEDLLVNNPGIQHVQQQGEQAIDRGAAARGLNQSGGTLTDLSRFNQGLAATNYQNLVLNPLFQLAGFGNQQASNQQQLVTGTGTNLSNIAMAQGNARGSAYQNAGNIIGNTANDVGNAFMLRNIFNNQGSAPAGNTFTPEGFTSASNLFGN